MSIKDKLLDLFVKSVKMKKMGMPTPRYNCIAYAVGFNTMNIWPIEEPPTARNFKNALIFWPTDLPFDSSIDNFVKMFEKFGFQMCDDDSFEKEYRKIAIYCDDTNKVKHAAVLCAPGVWKSKLGESFLVEHTLKQLVGEDYGNVKYFMKRPLIISKDFLFDVVEKYIKNI